MKTLMLWLMLAVCACQPLASSKPSNVTLATPTLEAHFSPKGGCTTQVVKYVNASTVSVRVLAYSFTSKPIIDALVARKTAGVAVQVVLDRSDTGSPQVATLRAAGIDVWIDRKHVIAHNKTMVIDGKVVLTGSFNFTSTAETSNAENCLAVTDTNLASQYLSNWQLHAAHSELP
jgi:phosphatidylserine/phosphatidylglycerophosphate/cardiolipin synthase-like enzyme